MDDVQKKLIQNVASENAVLFDVICVSLHAVRSSWFKFGNNISLHNSIYSCVKPGGQESIVGTIQSPMETIVPGQIAGAEPNLQFPLRIHRKI